MGAGKGSGRGSMENLKRAGRTLFFIINMLGSLFLSSGPLLVSIADICIVFSAFTCCKLCFSFRADWATYSFRGSLVDIPLLSLGRSLAALCAYIFCGAPSLCHGPYFGITVVSGIFTTTFLYLKASLFDHFVASTPSGVSLSERRHRTTLPLLFLSSAVFALLHIIVAYRVRCQIRRKICFDRPSVESPTRLMSMSGLYQRIPRVSSPTFSRLNDLERDMMMNTQQEFNKDLPAHLLADHDSMFMSLKGLFVHYKSVEGKVPAEVPLRNTFEGYELPSYTRSLSSKSTSSSSTWDFVKRPYFTGSGLTSVQTPLLRSYSGENFSVYGSPLWKNNSPALNGWPAIMQQTHQGSLSSRNGHSQGSSSGVVFVHSFGGGVFSWRNVMSTVARETGCRVAAFDRPGWGLTTRLQRSEWEKRGLQNPYEMQFQVDLLLAFCQEIGLTSVVLVGHSDGGVLALMAAAKALHSKDYIQVEVKGVVLVGVSFDKEVVSTTARALLHTRLGSHMLKPLLRSEIAQVTNRRAWHDASKLTSEILDLYKAPLCVENWDKALSEVCKATSAATVLPVSTVAELVGSVASVPALVVAGVQDNLVPIKTARLLTSQLPNSRLLEIQNCGHLPHEECPSAFLSAMIPFMSWHLGSKSIRSESGPTST